MSNNKHKLNKQKYKYDTQQNKQKKMTYFISDFVNYFKLFGLPETASMKWNIVKLQLCSHFFFQILCEDTMKGLKASIGFIDRLN